MQSPPRQGRPLGAELKSTPKWPKGHRTLQRGLRGLIPSDEVTRHLVNLPLCTEAGYIRIRLGLGLGWARVGLERIRNGPSVGGSFAATWAHRNAGSERNVLDGRKGRAAKNSVLTAAQNSLNASGEKLTRACVPRAVNDTGQNQ